MIWHYPLRTAGNRVMMQSEPWMWLGVGMLGQVMFINASEVSKDHGTVKKQKQKSDLSTDFCLLLHEN